MLIYGYKGFRNWKPARLPPRVHHRAIAQVPGGCSRLIRSAVVLPKSDVDVHPLIRKLESNLDVSQARASALPAFGQCGFGCLRLLAFLGLLPSSNATLS